MPAKNACCSHVYTTPEVLGNRFCKQEEVAFPEKRASALQGLGRRGEEAASWEGRAVREPSASETQSWVRRKDKVAGAGAPRLGSLSPGEDDLTVAVNIA